MGLMEVIRKIRPLYKKLSYLNYERTIRENKELFQSEGVEGVKKAISASMERLVGYKPNFENPVTFNDKMQWMKVYWFDPLVVQCCDKDKVRAYVAQKGLSDILIPQIAVFNRASDIDLNKLPNKFVLKPSHDSGHTYICTDKETFNIKKVKKELNKWVSCDYTFRGMEWAYHNNHPTIVCEELIEADRDAGELFDYKFFCFNGKPEYIFFVSDRQNEAKSDFYNMDWELQSFRWFYEPSGKVHPKPKCFDQMAKYAEILSQGFPFVRVDFYESNGRVYFGELTFFHGSGYGWFKPEEWDKIFGDKITLPEKSKINPWEWVSKEGTI
jgi:hypothetical protein